MPAPFVIHVGEARGNVESCALSNRWRVPRVSWPRQLFFRPARLRGRYPAHFRKKSAPPATAVTVPMIARAEARSRRNTAASGITKMGTIPMRLDATPTGASRIDTSDSHTPR